MLEVIEVESLIIKILKNCDQNGFGHNFSAPRTPQQNGVVERKNRSLQEMSRTIAYGFIWSY